MSTTVTPGTTATTATTPAPTAADFAQPIYLEEPGAAGAASGGDASSLSDVAVIDLDDPNLLLHEMDTNADKDAYAAPPPLPDGRWQVKIKQVDVKNAKGEQVKYNVKPGKDGGGAYAYTSIIATVIDPSGKYDNIPLYDYFVSTRPNREGAIPIVRILTCLKVQLPAKVNAKVLLDEFFKAVAAEPLLEVDTVWEGGLDQADQERFESAGEKVPRVLGQHRFPQDAKGQSLPDIQVDTKLGKVNLHARPRINGYFPVGSAAAAGLALGPKGK